MNASKSGLLIAFVRNGSPAFQAGLRMGDIVVSVDGKRVTDGLEFGFFTAQSVARIGIIRDTVETVRTMHRPLGTDPGVRFRDTPVMRCANKCIFCFIDQMPPGLRKSLYVKDEDYRHSFTNGNYITLSHTPQTRLGRIAGLGLSPLYISVHATDRAVRNRMLGNSTAFDIMDQLRFLEKRNVRVHTQIVVCPGINDGRVLGKTIRDLLTLGEGLLSIAVVPVGLTRHRSFPLMPVNKQEAERICREVAEISDFRVAREGKRRIFCADELFIKAELPIPHKKYYEDYPQIENGVGLVRQLLEEWRSIRNQLKRRERTARSNQVTAPYLVVTSRSAFFYIRKIFDELSGFGLSSTFHVAAVSNFFFGETVTVAGLMAAADVIRTVKNSDLDYRCVFLPNVMFNTRGYTLDGYSKQRIEKILGLRVKVISTMKEAVENVFGKK